MDAETQRYLDDGEVGDMIRVSYRLGVDPPAWAEGEYGGLVRTKRGVWCVHLVGVLLIPTIDIETIILVVPAGCL